MSTVDIHRQHYNVTFTLLALAATAYALLQSLVAPALLTIQHDLDTTTSGAAWMPCGMRSAGNSSRIIDYASGKIAPPAPWITRATIMSPMELATPAGRSWASAAASGSSSPGRLSSTSRTTGSSGCL